MDSGRGDYFERGIDLFNAGRFFECHEAWEEPWKRSSGAEKLFYQGMIQAAVAILHAQRGNRAGAASVYAKALARLDPMPAEYMGLALGEFRESMRGFFAKAPDAKDCESAPPPPTLRRIRNLSRKR